MLTTHNIDIKAMLVWLTLPFYDFCGFRSVAVNSVYKLQFFYIYLQIALCAAIPKCFENAIVFKGALQMSMFSLLY